MWGGEAKDEATASPVQGAAIGSVAPPRHSITGGAISNDAYRTAMLWLAAGFFAQHGCEAVMWHAGMLYMHPSATAEVSKPGASKISVMAASRFIL